MTELWCIASATAGVITGCLIILVWMGGHSCRNCANRQPGGNCPKQFWETKAVQRGNTLSFQCTKKLADHTRDDGFCERWQSKK